MQIRYETAVYTGAGWRPVTITARAEPITDRRCRVVEVIDVDGHGTAGFASRTGARRQQFSVGGVARREAGVIKLTARLEIVGGEK